MQNGSSWCTGLILVFFKVCTFPAMHKTVCTFVERRSTRSIKVAKKPKTILKKPKLITKKTKVVKKTKPQVKPSVSQSEAAERVPRMYGRG